MMQVKNDARYAVFLLSGKVFSARVVDTGFVQDQGTKSTSYNWPKGSPKKPSKNKHISLNMKYLIMWLCPSYCRVLSPN
jgi:hypothetical protein